MNFHALPDRYMSRRGFYVSCKVLRIVPLNILFSPVKVTGLYRLPLTTIYTHYRKACRIVWAEITFVFFHKALENWPRTNGVEFTRGVGMGGWVAECSVVHVDLKGHVLHESSG